MDRKKFIKNCGFSCLGASSIGIFLNSCISTRNISASISGDNLVIPKSEFIRNEKLVQYIIVQNEQLQFPIYVFRFSESEFAALYLRCTHQGNELNAYGDKLVCSAHGSEFDNKGGVTNGPATNPLKSFPVIIDNQNILVSLKKT